MYKRILVPIDGSARSEVGLSEAMRLATRTDAAIRLIGIVEELPITLEMGIHRYAPKELRKLLRELGADALQKASKKVRSRCIPVDIALFEAEERTFEEQVAAEAAAWGADLIVVGVHRHRNSATLLADRRAEGIARATVVPVLAVLVGRTDEVSMPIASGHKYREVGSSMLAAGRAADQAALLRLQK